MNILVINTHSFVDLITNSSSELFVCDTKKSVETVKEIIVELVHIVNKKSQLLNGDGSWKYDGAPIDPSRAFRDIFNEPTLAEFDFDLQEFPRFGEWIDMFGDPFRDSWSSSDPIHPVLKKAENLARKRAKENPCPKYPGDKASKKVVTAYENAYVKHNALRMDYENIAYAKWNALCLDIYTDLYKWAAKINDIDFSTLGKPAVSGGSYPHFFFDGASEDQTLPSVRFVSAVEEATAWNYSTKKGSVILRSVADNSIPYGLMTEIENTFNCQRRHLG